MSCEKNSKRASPTTFKIQKKLLRCPGKRIQQDQRNWYKQSRIEYVNCVQSRNGLLNIGKVEMVLFSLVFYNWLWKVACDVDAIVVAIGWWHIGNAQQHGELTHFSDRSHRSQAQSPTIWWHHSKNAWNSKLK